MQIIVIKKITGYGDELNFFILYITYFLSCGEYFLYYNCGYIHLERITKTVTAFTFQQFKILLILCFT